jgi:SSS family solute:Na+ symporter
VIATLVLNALKVSPGRDHTRPDDYHADAGDPGVEELDLEDVAAEPPVRGPS